MASACASSLGATANRQRGGDCALPCCPLDRRRDDIGPQLSGESGGRHDVFLALAGILYRGGWTEDDALLFIRGMYRGLWDAQADFAAAATEVSTTYAKAREDGAVTGYARLSELIDAKVLCKAFTWLDVTTKRHPRTRIPTAALPTSR